ncbi:DUF2726 domain-containing protein [Deinococcus hopiensis]|uniref:Uncharacterized protein n=1 Tax=Deinococcus hopiensis KR-140 TaxID=695939 RepID=A0A1W1UGW7_9DEIO|nr:DUF2726 domain-containing protein [Deinococcus hopiensis]SMB80345.1 Protein of unknown function [Deinococcus hopiensis KR-140]
MHGFFAKRTPAALPVRSTALGSASEASRPAGSRPEPSPAATPRPYTREGDRLGTALREFLSSQRYEVQENVRLKDFLALTCSAQAPAGTLTREAVRRVDFLIVSRGSKTPVLGLMLADATYGRDRRRRTEPSGSERMSGSIVTLLEVQAQALLAPGALAEALLPHL